MTGKLELYEAKRGTVNKRKVMPNIVLQLATCVDLQETTVIQKDKSVSPCVSMTFSDKGAPPATHPSWGASPPGDALARNKARTGAKGEKRGSKIGGGT